MLSLFKVRPPLLSTQRVSIELLMRRTIETIGRDFARNCEVINDLSALQIDTSEPNATLLSALMAIADRLPPVSSLVETQIIPNSDRELPCSYHVGADGEPATIEIQVDVLADPLRSVLELANQYATHFWYASGQLETDQIHPNLTHLLPICCGFEILASDGSFYDSQWSDGGWHGWSMSRTGYYNAGEIGYAAALMARHRGEQNPRWMRKMRLDSRDAAKKAGRYFSDCDHQHRPLLFDADRIPSTRSNPAELAGWFGGEEEHFALAAGYVLQKTRETSSLVAEAAMRVARGTNPELVSMAIELLSQTRPVTEQVRELIENLIPSPIHAISIAALLAAATLQMPVARYRDPIAHLLNVYAEDSILLIDLIAQQGRNFESLDTHVCHHLAEAVQYSNQAATGKLVDCLHKISADPLAVIHREIKDPEIQALVLASVSDAVEHSR